jgi:hypothetical protein
MEQSTLGQFSVFASKVHLMSAAHQLGHNRFEPAEMAKSAAKFPGDQNVRHVLTSAIGPSHRVNDGQLAQFLPARRYDFDRRAQQFVAQLTL